MQPSNENTSRIFLNEFVEQRLQKAVETDGETLDLGCGDLPMEGAIGVDYVANPWVDVVWNLEQFPYPIPTNCAKRIVASHIVEHIKPWLFIDVMNEWWRIAKHGCELIISTPYAGSPQFWQDPTHIKGFNEVTFAYFDPMEKTIGDGLYKIYRPKPWFMKESKWNMAGNLEVLLIKRLDDPSYHKVERKT